MGEQKAAPQRAKRAQLNYVCWHQVIHRLNANKTISSLPQIFHTGSKRFLQIFKEQQWFIIIIVLTPWRRCPALELNSQSSQPQSSAQGWCSPSDGSNICPMGFSSNPVASNNIMQRKKVPNLSGSSPFWNVQRRHLLAILFQILLQLITAVCYSESQRNRHQAHRTHDSLTVP